MDMHNGFLPMHSWVSTVCAAFGLGQQFFSLRRIMILSAGFGPRPKKLYVTRIIKKCLLALDLGKSFIFNAHYDTVCWLWTCKTLIFNVHYDTVFGPGQVFYL